MQTYQYKTGDRPLEGYTIQRGVGRGAFGEVYYALSDSGREVALKSVLGYEQIELRGVSQCMNLKSPYLVNIFDVRRNEEGRSFVIMEYVAGPSLRDLLNDAPSGLGAQKTAFFLREIGKGLTYLHDRGIVHRDLKPGNIFYEDGYVKIGDYGLSKAISPSQHSGQTITVGTVHYMAPEIGQGRYDKSIDVYALGVLVFEMLTGHVPFFGASHGEILMKHLMETPDLSTIEEPFATVIRKALAKDPNDRYQTVQEMVEAVFGAEHIAESVSVFRPESLSVVAEHAARKLVTVGGAGSSGDFANELRVDRPQPASPVEDGSDVWLDLGRKMEQVTQRFREAGERIATESRSAAERLHGARGRFAAQGNGDAATEPLPSDPMTRRQRRILAISTAAVMGLGTGFLSGGVQPEIAVFAVFMGVMGGSAALAFANRRLLSTHELSSGFARRLILAVPGFFGLFALSGLCIAIASDGRFARDDELAATYFACGITMLVVRWDRIMASRRQERVILGQAVLAAAMAFALALVFDGVQMLAMGMMAGVALVAQITSPFCGTAGASRLPVASRHGWTRSRRSSAPPPLPAGTQRPSGTWSHRTERHPTQVPDASVSSAPMPPTPVGLRVFWLLLLVLTLGIGLFLAIASGFAPNSDFPFFLGGAVACGIGTVGSLIQVRRRTYLGWWGSLAKPLLRTVCLGVAVFSMFAISEARSGSDEALLCAFFVGFPGAVWLASWFIPNDLFGASRPDRPLFGGKAASTGAGTRSIAANLPPTPVLVRIFWLLLLVAAFGLGLFCAIGASVSRGMDFSLFVGAAVACGTLAISSLLQVRRSAYTGWWPGLVKPLVRALCMGIAIFSGFALSEARSGSDDALVASFFLGFPAAIWLTLWFIPDALFGRPQLAAHAPARQDSGKDSERQWLPTLLLTCLGFAGCCGLQRFYVGKIGTGLLYLLTGGLFLIGQIYDLIMITTGQFTDVDGRIVREKSDTRPVPVNGAAPVDAAAGVPAAVEAREPPEAAQPQIDAQETRQFEEPTVRLAADRAETPFERPSWREESASMYPRIAREPRRTSLVVSLMAYAVLIPAAIVGAIATLQLPSFLAVCVPDLAQEITRDLDYGEWPSLVTRIALAISSILFVVSALLFVLARREAGMPHVSRSVLAIVGLCVAGFFSRVMLDHVPWVELVTEPRPIQRLEMTLSSIHPGAALIALLALLVSGTLLFWPERREVLHVEPQVMEGVAA